MGWGDLELGDVFNFPVECYWELEKLTNNIEHKTMFTLGSKWRPELVILLTRQQTWEKGMRGTRDNYLDFTHDIMADSPDYLPSLYCRSTCAVVQQA